MNNMNKILAVITAAILSCSPIFAMQEAPDTLLHITTPSNLLITESPAGMKVTVTDSVSGECIDSVLTEYSSYASIKTDTDTGKGYFREKRPGHNILELCDNSSPWGVSMLGVCVGLTNPLGQGSPEGLQWSKSFEISWLSCINVYYSFGRSDISFGLGFDWRNYKATTAGRRLVANDNKGIEWGEYPEGVTPKYSRLKVFSLQVPVLYRWSIPKSSLNLRIGPVLNFNTYASLLTVWDDPDGHKMEDFTKAVSPRRFTVDFFGSLSFNNIVGLYVRYSPMKVMDASPSVNFNPLTIGVTIGI